MLGMAMDKTMASLCTGINSFQLYVAAAGKRFQLREEASWSWEGIPGLSWKIFSSLEVVLKGSRQHLGRWETGKLLSTTSLNPTFDSLYYSDSNVGKNCNTNIIWSTRERRIMKILNILGQPAHPQCKPPQYLRQLGRQRRYWFDLQLQFFQNT